MMLMQLVASVVISFQDLVYSRYR